MKKSLSIISGSLITLVVFPIWYYLLYKILQAVNATELMWFLFWIYTPVHLISFIIAKAIKEDDE
jgi:hypothetical protein